MTYSYINKQIYHAKKYEKMLHKTTQTPNRNAAMLVRIRKSDMGQLRKQNFFSKNILKVCHLKSIQHSCSADRFQKRKKTEDLSGIVHREEH